ncbi:sensor histidine kinase [Rufibacter hautae]|uniref:histidine kinase n=1 Tax=Rufibacter hautae TaxID=2595005 RepID=A0A5B6TK03_9BACT|nr:HAMP domain-containing sensor histidine kinase [Rufibacter hautae]KAA3439717.1 HAMP domain-containing histidine kinase [Rufibacter hautae]
MLLLQISSDNAVSSPANASGPDGLVLVGDLMVVTAYILVAGTLFYLAVRQKTQERKVVLALFGVTAIMGGALHSLNFWGNDNDEGLFLVLRLVFGVIALVTTGLLIKAVPGVLAIPSPAQLQKTNEELREQIAERERTQVALRQVQQELEQRVQERSARAITATRELEREVENRKRAEKQLISKNYELVKKNADLDDFVYYASRDLRAPVLNVSGLVEALREELPPDNPEFNQLFARLDDSVSSIHRKLHNITEVSRIQRPVKEEELSMVSFEQVLELARETLAEPLNIAEANLHADFSAAPEVFFSRDNLLSLLTNLISNAIKFRDAQRPLQIFLSTRHEDHYVVLTVRDNGIGMDLSQYGQHLFSLFRRFHDHVEGSGVGLYIIKRIMDNNRGKVEVESVLGEGTTFLLYFVNREQ